jgi:hypothetical protein
LRKTLIAALAALTALALAAVAMAQNPAPTASLEVSVAPSKVGTKKKPRSGRLELSATTNRESKSTASKIEIWIPKGAKLSTKGLKACSFGKANAQGRSACPKASKAGSGEADALLNPYATNPAPIKFIVTAFNGGKLNSTDAATLRGQFPSSGGLYKKGREYLVFHLQSASPEVDQALAGVITKVSHRLYAQKLTIDIAPNLQQPANNVYSSLQRLETSIGLKSRKNMLMKLTDCPKARENQFQLRLTFVPNPTPPATTTATAIDGARCSG